MRVTLGRGDWRPANRINGLVRYAFIGDSTIYGAGVPPDQTLPAHTERQLNESIAAKPVEVVNLGISGYNLWHSWLSFRHGPQVYDGVVLGLCNNDAEMFSLSYPFVYPKPHDPQWEADHPFGMAVERCFDEIALFSRENALPVAVVFVNMWEYQSAIGKRIGEICSARGICYLNAFDAIKERNLPRDDKIVSKADGHPSGLVHEIVARALAALLKREGWFAKFSDPAVEKAPGRILSTAQRLVERDRYPADAALNWALGALESKSRVAQRMRALEGDRGFGPAAEPVKETLSSARRQWHASHRLDCYLQETRSLNHAIVSILHGAGDEKLRIDEICFALGTGDWERLAERSFDIGPPQPSAAGVEMAEEASFFDRCVDDLEHAREAIDSLRALAAPQRQRASLHDGSSLQASVKTLDALADRIEEQCLALKAGYQRSDAALKAALPTLPEARAAQVAGLLGASAQRARQSFGYLRGWPALILGLRDLPAAAFTTVEVTLSNEAFAETAFCLISARFEYSSPERLPFQTNGGFMADGLPMLVKLRLPLFYAGRLNLRTTFMNAPGKTGLDVKFHKIEVYNLETRRLAIPVALLQKTGNGYVSPVFYIT